MTTPVGQIKLSDLRNEFLSAGVTSNISLSSFYYSNQGKATSGTIRMQDLRGLRRSNGYTSNGLNGSAYSTSFKVDTVSDVTTSLSMQCSNAAALNTVDYGICPDTNRNTFTAFKKNDFATESTSDLSGIGYRTLYGNGAYVGTPGGGASTPLAGYWIGCYSENQPSTISKNIVKFVFSSNVFTNTGIDYGIGGYGGDGLISISFGDIFIYLPGLFQETFKKIGTYTPSTDSTIITTLASFPAGFYYGKGVHTDTVGYIFKGHLAFNSSVQSSATTPFKYIKSSSTVTSLSGGFTRYNNGFDTATIQNGKNAYTLGETDGNKINMITETAANFSGPLRSTSPGQNTDFSTCPGYQSGGWY
jgi:hypothetical protein